MWEAVIKFELYKKKWDEAVKAQDHGTRNDLGYYAIPDMEARIRVLNQGQDKNGKTAPAERQGSVPHTGIETDSESSNGPESNAD